MRRNIALFLLVGIVSLSILGCAPDAPSVSYRYRGAYELAGLAPIRGEATNNATERRTIILEVMCGDGSRGATIRLPNVAPAATAGFDEPALCDTPDASIGATRYE